MCVAKVHLRCTAHHRRARLTRRRESGQVGLGDPCLHVPLRRQPFVNSLLTHLPPRMAAIALAVAGYFMFSLQDAAVKWLVADHTVWEILLVRSLTITLLCLVIGRAPLAQQVLLSTNKGPLLLR